MKFLRNVSIACTLSALLFGGLGYLVKPTPSVAQEKPAPVVQKYFKGRVAPKNLDHLRKVKFAQHGHHLKRMKGILAAPGNWDSRTKNWVGPTEDQSQCGSCWCFSGTRVVDVSYMVAGMGKPGQVWQFSEQYTLDCGKNGGCNGDDNTTVLDWAKSTGLPLQSQYTPYSASAGRCTWSSSVQLYKITDWGFADSNGGSGVTPASDIKAAIMQYGCVGCAVAADNSFSNYEAGTVFSTTTSQSIDHDVTLIGWDDSKSKTPGKTVWLMLNSWGDSWGDKGTMWIQEGTNLIGTESVWASTTNPSPTPAPLPPFVLPKPGTANITIPGNGWSGTLIFDNGMLTTVAPKDSQPAPAIKP